MRDRELAAGAADEASRRPEGRKRLGGKIDPDEDAKWTGDHFDYLTSAPRGGRQPKEAA